MTIDLLIHAPTKPALDSFYVGRGLVKPDGQPSEGFVSCLWAGNGKMMTARPVFNPADPFKPLQPATYLNGIVGLGRLYGERAEDDIIIPNPTDPNRDKQWARSKLALWFKTNGNAGQTQGISWYGVAGERLYDPVSVNVFLAANDLPGHQWAGGNSY
jgi:hypothetical protein